MTRKVTVHEEDFGKREGLPKITRENFAVNCGRCNATLGEHLGYRCIDDKGTFQPPAGQGRGE